MKLRRISLIVFLLALGLVYPAPDAFACSCAAPPSDEAAVRDAAAVFSGVAKGFSESMFSDDVDAFAFEVDQAYKGQVSTEQRIHLPGGADPNACGYHFESGKRYLVFAYRHPKNGLSHR